MKCKKWTDQHDTSMEPRRHRSPRRTSGHQAGALLTELRELMESKVISLSSYVTGVLHIARISSVKVIMSVTKEKIWWILSSVMKCENWTDQHGMSEEQRKNLSSRQELHPWPPKHQAGILFTELRELMEGKVNLLSSSATGILHTVRISTVKVTWTQLNDPAVHEFS